jgi:hypothetical protein
MNIRTIAASEWRSRFSELVGKFDSWWIKSILIPLLSSVPPAVVYFYLRPPAVLHGAVPPPPSVVVDLIQHYPYLFAIAIPVYIVLVTSLIRFIETASKLDDELKSEHLVSLFDILERVVGAEGARYGSYAKTSNPLGIAPITVFEEIIQPYQQIALLAEGIHTFFKVIDSKGAEISVTVCAVEGGKPKDWVCYYPSSSPPNTEMDKLTGPNSAITYCISSKKLIIIEDLIAEAKKDSDQQHYVPRDNDLDEHGSLICYPIIHTYTGGDVPYVITVVADRRRYFKKGRKRLYNWILKHFAVRMQLEHSLIKIGEAVKL